MTYCCTLTTTLWASIPVFMKPVSMKQTKGRRWRPKPSEVLVPEQAGSRVSVLRKPLHYFSVSHCQNRCLEPHECLGSVASDITVGQNLVAVNLEILLITQGSFQFLPIHSLSFSKPLCCTSGKGTKSAAILIAGL